MSSYNKALIYFLFNPSPTSPDIFLPIFFTIFINSLFAKAIIYLVSILGSLNKSIKQTKYIPINLKQVSPKVTATLTFGQSL